jgi:hypothetical protein
LIISYIDFVATLCNHNCNDKCSRRTVRCTERNDLHIPRDIFFGGIDSDTFHRLYGLFLVDGCGRNRTGREYVRRDDGDRHHRRSHRTRTAVQLPL